MPYRRLPNTDAARIKAMKTALSKGREIPPQKLAYSARNIVKLQQFLPRFEHNIHLQRQTQTSQSKKSKNYYEIQYKAKLYLTHFVRVMNMAVIRGELPESIRQFYGLEVDDSNVPSFNSEHDLIRWGHSIIEGEEKRLMRGGTPITNPSIAVVKVWFEKFLENHNFHKTIAKKASDYSERRGDMRVEADELILDIWNEVESHFKDLPEEKRRKECEKYGLVYFFRKGELEKIKKNMEMAEAETDIHFTKNHLLKF